MNNFNNLDGFEHLFLDKPEKTTTPASAVRLFADRDKYGKLRYDTKGEEKLCTNCNKRFQICLHKDKGVCYQCYEKLTRTKMEVQKQSIRKPQKRNLLKPRPDLLSERGQY